MRETRGVYPLAITGHDGIRMAEVGLVLFIVAGATLAGAAVAPSRSKLLNLVGGLALAIGSVLLIVAIHWGRFG